MRFTIPLQLAVVATGFPFLAACITFDCENVLVDQTAFDLSPLSGPHTVHKLYRTPTGIRNTTFLLDICKPLKRSSGKEKDEECPNGSIICALERFYMKNTKGEPIPDDVWPIAGEFLHEGRTLDPEQTRLRNSESHADAEKEGLRLLINGGIHEKVKQRALIEFICDRKRTGLEGEETAEKKQKQSTVRTSLARARNSNNDTRDGDGKDGQGGDKDEDGGDGSGGDDEPLPDPDAGKSLQLISYEQTSIGKDKEEVGTLRLEWRTKYACEDIKDTDPAPPKKSRGWGFFTWFIIVSFLLIASYLIFGSWLNYSRHGARGWDLLPHGDTIRDVPYLFKEWARNVMSMIRGGGNRGGYNTI